MICTDLMLIPLPDALRSLAVGVATAAAIIAAGFVLAAAARVRSAPYLNGVPARPPAPPLDHARQAELTHVLIVGAGARGRELAEAIVQRPELGFDIVGFVDDEPNMPGWDGIPILGSTREIASVVERHRVDEIMVAHAPSWQETLMNQLVTAGQDERVRVTSVLGMRDAMTAELHLRRIADIPLVAVNGHHPSIAFRAAKRCFDVALSLVALILGAPFLALMTVLIPVSSRGPAFFCQRRVGLRGKEFTIYKLRTMVANAERYTGPVLADPYDARVTPLGRILRITRLDELPQFVNVLKGDMSVVGPRPERPEFVGRFMRSVPGYGKRMAVKPGITGLAQVWGDYSTDVHTKLKYDWLYVYRQSVWLDLKILLHTVRVVLLCAGQ